MKLDDFADSMGRPLPEQIKHDLQEAIVKTITHPDSDVSAVVKRAQTIARRALDGEIHNVPHYAAKALFAVSRKQQRLNRGNSASPESPEIMAELAGESVEGSPSAIEAKILLNELLSTLSKIERDVFIRHTMGWRHRRIADQLGISVAMSSYYLLRAKASLHRALRGEGNAK